MSDETQFRLADLDVVIDEIWDENDGEVVLTLVAHAERGVSGFIELVAEAVDDGTVATVWRWTVNEPQQQEVYSDSCASLRAAARELKHGMVGMTELIRERDGEA